MLWDALLPPGTTLTAVLQCSLVPVDGYEIQRSTRISEYSSDTSLYKYCLTACRACLILPWPLDYTAVSVRMKGYW